MLYKGNQKLIGQTYTIQEIKKAIYPVGSVIISFVVRDFTIEMPDTTWELEEEGRLIEATRDTTKVNTLVEAGLPNITGTIDLYSGNSGISGGSMGLGSGALSKTTKSSNNTYTGFTSHSSAPGGIKFDAKKSNSIYGASDTVQPNTRKYYIYRRIA